MFFLSFPNVRFYLFIIVLQLWIITSNSVTTLDPDLRKVCLQVQFPWHFILPVLLRSLIVLCMTSDILCLNNSIPWQQNILGHYCLPSSAYNKLQKMMLSLLMYGYVSRRLCAVQQCTHRRCFSPASCLLAGQQRGRLLSRCGLYCHHSACTHKKKNSEIYITFLSCHHNLGIIAFWQYLWQKFNSLSSRTLDFCLMFN